MPYQRKTKDEWQMWSHYGHGTGWTHELSEDSWPAMHDQLRTYRMNCPGAQFRAIKKRVHIEEKIGAALDAVQIR